MLGEVGRRVPVEEVFPPTAVSLDLAVPAELFLADSCGGVSTGSGGGRRLQSSCTLALADLAVCGGRLRPIDDVRGVAAFAVLPAHVAVARRHLPALAQAAEAAVEAWPGVDPLSSSVVIEWPPPAPDEAVPAWSWWSSERQIETHGRLTLFPELLLASREPISSERFAARALAEALASRRRIVFAQQAVFRALLRNVALIRLGKGRAGRAVVGKHEDVTDSILLPGDRGWKAIEVRLPAVLHDVMRRAGFASFAAGVEDFLRREGQGTVEELLRAIGDRGGVSLEAVYRDYFAGSGLPVLTLEDVAAPRGTAGETVVTGTLRNLGTGEAVCPVVLRTDLAPVAADVRVGGKGATRFALRTHDRARAVLLDPGKDCYRLSKVGLVDAVELAEPR